MPTLRIDPGGRKNRLARASKIGFGALGTIAAAPLGPFAPIVGAVFGKVGSTLGHIFNPHKKTYPFTVDTETNKVTLLRKEAPITSKKGLRVQAELQSVWDTGTVPKNLPKRYRDEVALLLQQRNEFILPPGPAAPAVTEGAQYSGEYSMAGIIPPGGFAGFAQMTPASKAAQGLGRLVRSARKRTRKKKASNRNRKRKASGRKRKAGKLVKGSAAAKRFMANLRRKRK